VNENDLILINLKENQNVVFTKSTTKLIDSNQSIF